MAQPDVQIRSLLQGRLASLADAPPIAWENQSFVVPDPAPDDPADAALWLRPTLHFAGQTPETLFGQGSEGVYDTGLFLVDCFGRQDGGPEPIDALAASVRAWMRPKPPQLVGSSVRVVIERTYRGPGMDTPEGEPPFYMAPVTIVWRAWYATA
jgi:hypothetical protein